jgi:hypothetical protein
MKMEEVSGMLVCYEAIYSVLLSLFYYLHGQTLSCVETPSWVLKRDG